MNPSLIWVGLVSALLFMVVAAVQQIQLVKADVKLEQQQVETVKGQLESAQAAYRRSIAEKHLLTNELHLAKALTQEREAALKLAQEQARSRQTTIVEVIDESGCFDAELPAAVLGMYTDARGAD